MRQSSRNMALGGVFGALAVVFLLLGGFIPGLTYVLPMVCMILECEILRRCGKRIGWAWYGAVAILGVLLCPDKEGASLFVALGYYPMIKPWMDRRKLPFLWKVAFFNVVILLMYRILISVMGADQLSSEFAEMGKILLIVLMVMGNICFLLVDFLVKRFAEKGIAVLFKKK